MDDWVCSSEDVCGTISATKLLLLLMIASFLLCRQSSLSCSISCLELSNFLAAAISAEGVTIDGFLNVVLAEATADLSSMDRDTFLERVTPVDAVLDDLAAFLTGNLELVR